MTLGIERVRAAVLILALLAATSVSASGLAGNFAGRLNGEPMRASLTENGNTVNGTLAVGGYVYRIAAQRHGHSAQGEMRDQDGAIVPLGMRMQGDRLALQVYLQGAGAPPVEIVLDRKARQGAKTSRRRRAEADPALVGRWVRSESYSSGDFSMVNQERVTIFPDGTYVMGPARVAGGGNAGSFDSGTDAAAGERGRWRTANRVLYVAPVGSDAWDAYARYYVEGAKLLLTFGDGSRELWRRE